MEARSKKVNWEGVFVIRWLPILGKLLEQELGEDETVQGKACTAVQLQEKMEQNLLREWPTLWRLGFFAKYSFKDALVLNKERELVEQVVGENNSLMSVGVGNGLGEGLRPRRSLGRLGVSCGSGPVHEQGALGWWALQVSSSDEIVACGGGSGVRRVQVMVSEGECEGVLPSVGATRVEPEEAKVLEVNEVNRSMVLAYGKEMGIEEVKSDVADFHNLVDEKLTDMDTRRQSYHFHENSPSSPMRTAYHNPPTLASFDSHFSSVDNSLSPCHHSSLSL
ncbi:hypothetical protein ACSQ67_024045 [Phaseolus vulgaris]